MYKIPLYSKSPEYTNLPMFYDKTENMDIWIGKKKYIDMCHHLGTNLLGYNNKYINHHVINCINKGNVSLLNHRYMEKLANLMLSIHQWAEVVRFCNSGGEAMYLAFELAIEKHYAKLGFNKEKGYNEKNIIDNYRLLFSGYFGWILKNYERRKYIKNLGVDGLNSINKIDYRPDIFVFELLRHVYPKPKTINKLKKWHEQGTILVLDEITSGFRLHCGGAHLLYDLIPDICVFSKAIGNGYPISIIIGKEKYMESDLWISSTNWCDGIGFVAGYHTIKALKHCNYRLLLKLGQSVMKIWQVCADKYNIKIKLGEVPYIASFDFIEKPLELKSLFIQEMQKYGILASTQFYPSFSHTAKHIGLYAKACDKVFAILRRYLDGEKIEFKLLKELKK